MLEWKWGMHRHLGGRITGGGGKYGRPCLKEKNARSTPVSSPVSLK
jgi:hypothetical protein